MSSSNDNFPVEASREDLIGRWLETTMRFDRGETTSSSSSERTPGMVIMSLGRGLVAAAEKSSRERRFSWSKGDPENMFGTRENRRENRRKGFLFFFLGFFVGGVF